MNIVFMKNGCTKLFLNSVLFTFTLILVSCSSKNSDRPSMRTSAVDAFIKNTEAKAYDIASFNYQCLEWVTEAKASNSYKKLHSIFNELSNEEYICGVKTDSDIGLLWPVLEAVKQDSSTYILVAAYENAMRRGRADIARELLVLTFSKQDQLGRNQMFFALSRHKDYQTIQMLFESQSLDSYLSLSSFDRVLPIYITALVQQGYQTKALETLYYLDPKVSTLAFDKGHISSLDRAYLFAEVGDQSRARQILELEDAHHGLLMAIFHPNFPFKRESYNEFESAPDFEKYLNYSVKYVETLVNNYFAGHGDALDVKKQMFFLSKNLLLFPEEKRLWLSVGINVLQNIELGVRYLQRASDLPCEEDSRRYMECLNFDDLLTFNLYSIYSGAHNSVKYTPDYFDAMRELQSNISVRRELGKSVSQQEKLLEKISILKEKQFDEMVDAYAKREGKGRYNKNIELEKIFKAIAVVATSAIVINELTSNSGAPIEIDVDNDCYKKNLHRVGMCRVVDDFSLCDSNGCATKVECSDRVCFSGYLNFSDKGSYYCDIENSSNNMHGSAESLLADICD